MLCNRIWRNARLLPMTQAHGGWVEVQDGIVAAKGGRIAFAGARAAAPKRLDAPERIDCQGRWMTPGLIDCHTHLVYAGHRAAEFEQRIAGASYQQIAHQGGGILCTVRATRAACPDSLMRQSLVRVDAPHG